MKRLGIFGTFVWDTVWTLADQAAGRPFETWGGMAYSLAAAAAACPEGWEVVPIAHVGADLEGRAHDFIDTLGNIGPRSAVVAVAEPNNRVELVYRDEHERGERMRGGVPGWTWAQLEPHLTGLDALLVNFFSGWEMEIATAEALARSFPGPLYADLHSLFLGPPRADGPRLPRALPEWERWLACWDVVQMNEEERGLIGISPDTAAPPDELLRFGPEAVLVTLGPRGAAYAGRGAGCRPGMRGAARLSLAGAGCVPPARHVCGGDPTGSGDVWGATAWCGMIGGLSLEDAVRRANEVAVRKMEHRGGSGLYEHLRRPPPPDPLPRNGPGEGET